MHKSKRLKKLICIPGNPGTGKIAKNIGMIGVSALTGGLDEVYGTGKIQYGTGTIIKGDPKKDKKSESVDDTEDKVDKLIGK